MGFPRWRAAAAAAAVLAGLAGSALTATAASASTPAGVPSHSQVAQHHGLRPEFFTIAFTPGLGAWRGDRLRAGLRAGRTDNEAASGTLGVFTFRGGAGEACITPTSTT